MAIAELDYRFTARRPRVNDAQVEALIESAGRERVFEHAKRLGWGTETPPKWVWQQIALDIVSGRIPA